MGSSPAGGAHFIPVERGAVTIETKPKSSIPDEVRQQIDLLVQSLLDRYDVKEPPVPIEKMVNEPELGLWDADPTELSSTIGHGLYRFEPRMAQARLLYRAICDSESAHDQGLNVPWPPSRHEIKYFSRSLLMPEKWMRAVPDSKRVPDSLSVLFRVPSFDVVTRLAELGLPVRDASDVDPDP